MIYHLNRTLFKAGENATLLWEQHKPPGEGAFSGALDGPLILEKKDKSFLFCQVKRQMFLQHLSYILDTFIHHLQGKTSMQI